MIDTTPKDFNSDKAKAARRQRLMEVMPKTLPDDMPMSTFEERVGQRVVHRDKLGDIEVKTRVMFCPACRKNAPAPGYLIVTQLAAVVVDDPFENYPFMIQLSCAHCTWEETIAADPPPACEAKILRMWEANQIELGGTLLPREGPWAIRHEKPWGEYLFRRAATEYYTNIYLPEQAAHDAAAMKAMQVQMNQLANQQSMLGNIGIANQAGNYDSGKNYLADVWSQSILDSIKRSPIFGKGRSKA